MYLPPLLQLHLPPDDPGHRLYPAAVIAVVVSAVHAADPGVSVVLGASATLCTVVVLEV